MFKYPDDDCIDFGDESENRNKEIFLTTNYVADNGISVACNKIMALSIAVIFLVDVIFPVDAISNKDCKN